jgi:hypothetical protein
MVRCFFEERHGGSRPVLTETMAAATTTRGEAAAVAFPAQILDKKQQGTEVQLLLTVEG